MNIAIKTFAISLLFALGNITSQAATITVDTLEDVLDNTNGNCTLREAITAANNEAPEDNCVAGSGADEIVFASGVIGTVALSDQLPAISSDITISGPGRDNLIISGEDSWRVLQINNGTVVVAGITVANGFINSGSNGAGINISGNSTIVTLRNCRIEDNHNLDNRSGGGVFNLAELTIENCIIENNSIAGRGGGVINGSNSSGLTATLTIRDSIIRGNSANVGGGIYNAASGTASVYDSEISDNDIGGSNGSGIYNSGSMLVQNSRIENNHSDSIGSTISNVAGDLSIENSSISNNYVALGRTIRAGGTVTITNSTISGNYATDEGAVNDALLANGTVSLINSTISGNSGRGVYVSAGSGTPRPNITITSSTITENGQHGVANSNELNMQGSIVANNGSEDCFLSSGVYNNLGWNIDSDNTCQLTQATDHPGVDPLLGPLQDNDGYTAGGPGNRQIVPTHALLAFSPAIDSGDNATCPVQDQRGGMRPVDGDGDGTATCDIGAVEQVYEAHIVVTDGIAPVDDHDIPFGDVMVGDSLEHIVTLGNQGMQNLVIDGLALSSRAFSFDLNSGASPCGAFDIILGPSETCTMGISFIPVATGEQSGQIVITSNDPDEPGTVIILNGRGINPDLVADTNRQDFGLLNVGDASSQTITLSNTGVGLLQISAMSVIGSDASNFRVTTGSLRSACPAIPSMEINDGASCTIALEYSPTTNGIHIAQLELVSNDPDGSPLVIAVTGEGNSLPQFTGGTGSFDIAEDVANGTTVTTLQAVDVDDDVPVFSIVSGNQDGHFAIDSGSGEITVAANLDFETISSYQLGVRIDDGRGGTTTVDVIVNITDVDETQQNNSPGSGGGGGCSVRSEAPFDPLLPTMILIAMFYLARRRYQTKGSVPGLKIFLQVR